ncbi:5-dehydro-2-deoxygluconokinase [Streptomyces cinnabarinus]|uniref:5-dehydro-2-deoxygluconokinase n=1 Tax=Streptomyces cinnabarinus TaxID=67287 RepID=A0ABY7KG07_9ACTN|nr:5-dehydro-2-deoxygluconokinase [Streptomyces cinnabarinus]WAZ21876.1 5-dehydro-2-deoxygluconokinase [Streptomyces cinnabarinus]
MAYDLITMGRIGVDLYPLQTGVPLPQVTSFGKFLGGSAANVAVAAARLGRNTAVITRTGDDPFGTYLHEALRDFGVDDRWVTPVPGLPTPVTFCEVFPPDDFPLYFYRQPKAPDLEIDAHELDLDAIRDARVFWVTGTGLSEEPSRTATLAALAHRARAGTTVFDLDWRPMFWRDPDQARPFYREALRHTTVAVGNLDEVEVATGVREPHAAARALLDAGVELAVVKQGPKGVLAVHRDGDRAEVPPLPVEVLNGLGAGDAFGGSLVHGLLNTWDLETTMRHANAAGAIVASRLECSSAMPTQEEVREAVTAGAVQARQAPGRQAPAPADGASTPEGHPDPDAALPTHPPAPADGDSAPQGPPAPGHESRTGRAGGNPPADGEAEADR